MRWKTDERETSRLYQEIDGPTENPALKILQTSTGRLGHLNALRVDASSKNYMIEVKRRGLVAWLHKAWVLIQQKGRDFKVEPVLVLCMTDDQNSYEHDGKKYACEDIHGITASRHAYLLECERQLFAIRDEVNEVTDGA
jgi:hypothetical protein